MKLRKWQNAYVIEILDGDTFKAELEGREVTIRVAHIDAPEKGQPLYTEATSFARALLREQPIQLRPRQFDRYGRVVAEVKTRYGQDFSEKILQAGLAWWDPSKLKDLQYGREAEQAQKRKRGIWALEKPEAPWIYRRRMESRHFRKTV